MIASSHCRPNGSASPLVGVAWRTSFWLNRFATLYCMRCLFRFVSQLSQSAVQVQGWCMPTLNWRRLDAQASRYSWHCNVPRLALWVWIYYHTWISALYILYVRYQGGFGWSSKKPFSHPWPNRTCSHPHGADLPVWSPFPSLPVCERKCELVLTSHIELGRHNSQIW